MGSLVLGVIFLAVSAILFLVVSRASRRNVCSGCFSDGWVANFHAPVMIGLFAFGVGFLTKFTLAWLA